MLSLTEALNRARDAFNAFNESWHAASALIAFVNDGGDLATILAIEEAYEVTFE